ncbi:amino acid adenylation domain-containing protein [Streptomyces sp. NPDC050548]|uniref:amino acid adenylation domain-containing protein n=1 Tax=Streptomyces sp. NPDC050548 TaxID=3365629 RepID=UPI0037B65904
MRVKDCVAELAALGVTLYEESGRLGYRAPKGSLTPERITWLREHKEEVLAHLKERETGPVLVPDPAAGDQPFPLTDVQSAYLLGRNGAFDYGGVACHGYLEISLPEGAEDAVEDGWNTLVRRHPMLRAVVSAEGHQRVLPEVARYAVRRLDLRGSGAAAERRAVEEIRGAMSHQVRPTDQWPLFELRTTRTDRTLLLHLAIDLLVCDYGSIRILLAELHELCGGPRPASAPELTFRDYVLAARGARDGARHQRDHDYWWDRIDSLPPAPELPLRTDARSAPPRFRRLGTRLTPRQRTALERRATEAGATPSGLLLQSFAEVLGRWSGNPRFTLGLTLQNRLPLHEEVDRVVGDFSSTSLLAVDLTEGATLLDRTRATQDRLWTDLDHQLCSGVEVLRELARRRGRAAALMPVIFTSTVGAAGAGSRQPFMPGGELVHGITQTPQVWIDCQVMEDGDGLLTHWDVRAGVLPDGVAEDMFDAYRALLHSLAEGAVAWDATDPVELPGAQRERLARANDTAAPRALAPLHAEVVAQAGRTPDRTAVITSERRLDYRELLGRSRAVADVLTQQGAGRGERVGIVMDKGWEQVVAVLGVLLAGGAYVPVDTTQPPRRRNAVLAGAGVRRVLTQSWLVPGLDLPEGTRAVAVDPVPPAAEVPPHATGDPDDLAYVIYTSGSTGVPKGVAITHAAARNTVDDINSRFGVGADDRVLGLAQLGFDLSVYDIFGPLSVGGALVLPDAARRGDPTHWATLIERFGVSVWNSVPAQMQMLHEHLRTPSSPDAGRLRLAMLSGDWIPVTLPDAVRQRIPGLSVVSLGGATEASIWSICHPVAAVDPALTSIPYGRPLANQTFRVLDPLMRDCPEHVTGELYIGGAGLALGYLGDAERTAASFVRHPRSGERLYRTGDMGRRTADGAIEFLGRTDGQVKLNGHRVELAEVEVALQTHPAVHAAAAVVRGEGTGRTLVAFAEPARTGPAPSTDAGLAAAARQRAESTARYDESEHGAHVRTMCAALEESALQSITRLFRDSGLFSEAGHGHTAEEIIAACGATPRYHPLVRRWLTALTQEGRLRRDRDTGTYWSLVRVSEESRAAVHECIDTLEPLVGWGAELIRFHRDCEERLDRLVRGELPVKDLLFPEGRLDTAAAAYRDNLISRYNNAAVVEIVRRAARAKAGAGPLRILEVGAGVGGTSAALVPELRDLSVDYHFTDLSHFFLNEARETYARHPWVRYGLFDLNEDYRPQGLAPNSADVVLAANVLHNAVDADEMLRRLGELAAPGGWLVFVEATRDTRRGMTSMEFNDGLTGFTDERAEHGATFFTRRQWLDLLERAGAETVLCLPAEDSALAEIGQQVFAARFKRDRTPVTPDELRDHLAERLPAYMIPARLEVVDRIPLTANGKVDRALLREWGGAAAAEEREGAGDPPADELERALAGLWAEVLNVPAVGRNANFFALGGDSLLVAQLVGRMRAQVARAAGIGWDELLRAVLNRPTVATLAERLRGGAAGSASPLVEIDAGPPEAGDVPALVLVHDGTGTIDPYRALIQELSGRTPIVGLVVDDLDAYLAADPATVIGELADRYAEVLRTHGYSRVRLVGYCMGGLLATELADRFTRAGGEVTEVSVISSYRVPYRVEDDLLAEYVFARLMRADTVELGYPEDESAIRELVAAVVARHGGTVPAGSLTEPPVTDLGPAAAEALRAFKSLAARTQEERLRDVAAAMPRESAASAAPGHVDRVFRAVRHSLSAVARHHPRGYPGPVTLLRQLGEAEVFPGMHHDMAAYWQHVCTGGLRLVDVPGDHFTCVRPPHAAAVAELLVGEPASARAVAAHR